MAQERKYRGEVPLHDNYGPEAKYAVEAEALLPTTKHEEEIARGLEFGQPGAASITDRRIPTFSRGELPHFAGINTFVKAPYIEDVRRRVCAVKWFCWMKIEYDTAKLQIRNERVGSFSIPEHDSYSSNATVRRPEYESCESHGPDKDSTIVRPHRISLLSIRSFAMTIGNSRIISSSPESGGILLEFFQVEQF
ncbi:MAG: hypothetical protein H0X47_16795 [Nitrospirales bacterium]|nr:hypothetical protein [Nitrospirales bacterium]